MTWLQIEQSVIRHRKVLRAAALLKTDRHQVIGHLVEFWAWALDNLPEDGDLRDLADVEIADAAGWPTRDAKRFVEALVLAGLIDAGSDGGRRIHDWHRYGGRLASQREANATRQRRFKERKRDALAVDNAGSTGSVTRYLTQQSRVEKKTSPDIRQFGSRHESKYGLLDNPGEIR